MVEAVKIAVGVTMIAGAVLILHFMDTRLTWALCLLVTGSALVMGIW